MADVIITQLIKSTSEGVVTLIYPRTHAKAVVTADGTRLDAIIADILRRLEALEQKAGIAAAEVLENVQGIESNLASIIAIEEEKG